jgi:ubiquitin thioesterase OTU1
MKIRARGPNGLITLTLEPDSTLGELKNELIYNGFQNIKSISVGFPTRKIQNGNEDSLAKCGITNGESIIVEVLSENEAKLALVSSSDAKLTESNAAGSSIKNEVVEDKETVTIPGGEIVVRTMKDDNSCLFSSIAKLFLWDISPTTIQKLRQMVSDIIITDPINYNAAVLEKDPFDYCEWIRRENSWGGAIELKVFSEVFKTAITSVDISTGRMDTFGEGGFNSRAFVMYR